MAALEQAPPGFAKVNLKYGPYSASKLITARCPARFEGKYIRKDRVVADRENAARGTAIHWVLQRIGEKIVQGEPIKTTEVDGWIAEAVGRNPAAYGQIDLIKSAVNASLKKPSPYLNKNSQLEVGLALALYQEETFVDDVVPTRAWVKVPYVDPYDNTLAPTDPNIIAFICCKIDELNFDFINKTIVIADHKTTPSSEVNADTAFQLATYAWMISQYYPGWTVRTSVHFAHPMLNFYTHPETWPDDALAETETGILTRAQAVEAFEEHPAIPGSNCDYCHMAMHCPELKALEDQNASLNVPMIARNGDDLQKMSNKVRVLGVAYDHYMNALKKNMKALNIPAVAIDGMIYEFRVSDSIDWQATDLRIREEAKKAEVELANNPNGHPDAARLKLLVEVKNLDGMLAKFGVNPNLLKNYGSDNMKGLWKLDKPELHLTLQPMIYLEKKTRFGGYKS